MRVARLCLLIATGVLLGGVLAAQTREPVDTATIAKIRDEGLNRSQVGAMFAHLVDVIGPRLAGSRGYDEAAAYARDRLASWGLSNPRLEPFEFSRGKMCT
jgi:hypothetical protein